MLPLVLVVTKPWAWTIWRPARRSMVAPLVLAEISAFCKISCPAFRLVLPPRLVLVTVEPKTISKVLPACK